MHAFPRRRRHLSAGVNNHRDLVSGSLAGRSSVLGMPGSALAHKLGLSVVGKALPMPEARVGDGSTREQASRSSHVVEQSSPGPQQAPKSGERVARPGSSSQALPGFCSARTLAQISSVVCADPRPPGIGAPPAEGAVEFEAPSPDSSRISAEVRNSEDVSPVLVNRSMISGNGPNLSPGFESAAALAGWDFNSLLLAASLRENDEDNQSTHSERGVELPVQRTPDPGRRDNIRSLSCNCGVCRSCTDRKRVERTPGHASTPVSANRRHRRYRTEIIDPIMNLPLIGRLNLSNESATVDGVHSVGDERHESPASSGQPSRAETDPGTVEDEPLQEAENLAKVPDTEQGSDAKPAEEMKKHASEQIACIEQLRDELSCAVCLDICYEPVTTGCGHSFCKTCLLSAIDRCGSRCPKCRYFVRDEVKSCRLNTALWNTIQLLFPAETSAKKLERSSKPTAISTTTSAEGQLTSIASELFLSTAVSRAVRTGPWRNANPPQRPPPPPPPSFLPPLTAPVSVVGPLPSIAGPMRYYFSTHRSTRSVTSVQEQEDFLLARRLQNEEQSLANARGNSVAAQEERRSFNSLNRRRTYIPSLEPTHR